jgi:pyruvate dehydrogenase E2 component (dihydrolipoyllysine-residue acetyltransferase)
MAKPVEMPKLGNTVNECIVTKWRKRKGERVSAGEVIAEIETDKATFEVPAPMDGTLLETFFDEGMLVPVYTNLFVIGEPGENADIFRPSSSPVTAAGSSAPGAAPALAPDSKPATPLEPQPRPASEAASRALRPRAGRFADDHDFQPPAVAGSGPGGRVFEQDLRTERHGSPAPSTARKPLPGSAAVRREDSQPAGMIRAAARGPAPTRISIIREIIARRMRESLASTAQYTLNTSADARGLLALRATIKASTAVPDININDLVTFCAVQALLQMPDLNAEFIDGKIYHYPEIHIGIACDTPRGLMAPVIRDAHRLTIGELALTMKESTAQAVQGTIPADRLSGATFTISNLGGLDIESFTPLLNPPQVAILGVGAICVKPVRRQGKLEFIDAIGLSLTCDHQVIDGAPGARFLQILKDKIENVESLCSI